NDAAQNDAAAGAKNGGGRDANAGQDAARPYESGARIDGAAAGDIAFLCPVHLSEDCVDVSRCESTCLGQVQTDPTCTWYAHDATANVAQCNAVGSPGAVYTCPPRLSTDCSSAVQCESACVGQYQPAATCTVHSKGGVAADVACDDARGKGP